MDASSHPARQRQTGFTLVEVLATLAIVGVLSAIAAPSFSELVAKQRTRAAATDLYISLSKARSEAIKRNVSITLSPKDGNWAAGWQIMNPSDSTARIEDHNPITGADISGPASVVYLTTGRVRGGTRPEFDISIPGTAAHACVTVDLSGMPTQKSAPC